MFFYCTFWSYYHFIITEVPINNRKCFPWQWAAYLMEIIAGLLSTLCSGRWLNMMDTVKRPLWKYFIGQVEKRGESVTEPAQWKMQWTLISFILTLKNVCHFAVHSFYLWNELHQHKLWQLLQANIRTCRSSTSFCFRRSCKLNH